MPATSKQTRLQLRQSIGLAAEAVNIDAGAVTHTISETALSGAKFIDEYLPFGSEDEHRGKWVLWTDSGSSTEVRRVHGSNPDERSITLSVPLSATPTSSGSYELWDQGFSPIKTHDLINQAIRETYRKGSVNAVDQTYHTGGSIGAFALSSTWTGVRAVRFRKSFVGESLTSLDNAMSSHLRS